MADNNKTIKRGVVDPYKKKLVNRSFYSSKTDIKGRFVVVLEGLLNNRGLNLIHPISRAFPKGTIIELIGTDEIDAAPGTIVNNICYIGFVELVEGGVILTGDKVYCGDMLIGNIAGYDDTHMPNHQNTIIFMENRRSGRELGLKINDELIIKGF
jgi:hypothetical protein